MSVSFREPATLSLLLPYLLLSLPTLEPGGRLTGFIVFASTWPLESWLGHTLISSHLLF